VRHWPVEAGAELTWVVRHNFDLLLLPGTYLNLYTGPLIQSVGMWASLKHANHLPGQPSPSPLADGGHPPDPPLTGFGAVLV
jgi:hypothetical protein